MIDDVLHRYYVPQNNIQDVKPGRDEPLEKFDIKQIGRSEAGAVIQSVGPATRITDWDAFGRRIYSMATGNGGVDVQQCITQITSRYVVVEAYKNYKWTQYIATNSIKADMLRRII